LPEFEQAFSGRVRNTVMWIPVNSFFVLDSRHYWGAEAVEMKLR